MLFQTPELDTVDLAVIGQIDQFRNTMRFALREPRRWTGQLRRNLLAKAIQGSNSIEGYDVTDEDAVAAVEEEEPLTADEATWAEIRGYRSAMSYVLQLADDPDFSLDQTLIRSLHYMMLSHDLSKSPGRYRSKPVFVVDEARGRVVYEGPEAEIVPELTEELVQAIRKDTDGPSFVRAAMAHLNLVMIHPFRDGNGRMARCLQTLILAREQIVAPEFSSVEEFLGRSTPDYYAILAAVGAGSWNPGNDATPWVKFILRAHHIQAQVVVRRLKEASAIWSELDSIATEKGLPERSVAALFDASLGLRLRRSNYIKLTDVEDRTATRDLQAMTDAGLLVAKGERRGRVYAAAEPLLHIRRSVRSSQPGIVDPYGDISSLLRNQSAREPELPLEWNL
ncbi:Fic family protein [Lentzea sp. JNUCC 0626]|uniref:Fic family protein n=1 Tax=Lentzea sp. JNUCC 0626 TaxID=3367513 RepID=UPI003748AF39